MTKEFFIEKLQASSMSADVKQRIMEVLESGEFDQVKLKINDIIQDDMDKNLSEFDGLLNAEDAAKIQEAQAELSADLAATEETLQSDLAFVEAELAELEETGAEVNKIKESLEIEAARNDIRS